MDENALPAANEPGWTEAIIVPGTVQAEAQAKAQELNAELGKTRMILSADQLASMSAPRARLETSYERFNAYFFSIDGILNGKKVQGALFAGECMLIFAMGESTAQDLANRGLRSTIELIHDEFDTRNSRAMGTIEPGMSRDVSGRRAGPEPGSTLETPQMKKLVAIMKSEIFGDPFRF